MIELLKRLGKTSAVVGENSTLIVLLATIGPHIKPEHLIVFHSIVMTLKGMYLSYNIDKSLDIARNIVNFVKEANGKASVLDVQRIIQEGLK